MGGKYMRKIARTVFFVIFIASLISGCGKSIVQKDILHGLDVSSSIAEDGIFEKGEATSVSTMETLPKEVDDYYHDDTVCDEYADEIVFPENVDVITLSGNPKDFFCSQNYSVLESEKYILLIDKNVKLPGNYALMLDEIVDAIEAESGLSFRMKKKAFNNYMTPAFSGDYPWKDLKSGDKFIIQLNYASEAHMGDAPERSIGYITLYDRGLNAYEDEIYDVSYSRAVFILCSALAYSCCPEIYGYQNFHSILADRVEDDLSTKYPRFKGIVDNGRVYMTYTEQPTIDNVNTLWVNKCKYWEQEEANSFLDLFEEYMFETYGNNYIPMLINDIKVKPFYIREGLSVQYKKVFGKDVFRDYIVWLSQHSVDFPVEIVFDGKEDGVIASSGKRYAEGERCFLYIDEGLILPNDYLYTADSIVGKLQLQMFFDSKVIEYEDATYFRPGFYGLSNNGKLPVFVLVDTDNVGMVSYAIGSIAVVFNQGIITSRNDIEYSTLAHEISHAVLAYHEYSHRIGKIMFEGSADFYAEEVLKELDISDDEYRFYHYSTPINADTAESLFMNDFTDVSHGERGAEYYMGYWLCRYLKEEYGDHFFVDFYNAIQEADMSYCEDDEYGTNQDRAIRTQVMKNVFGDDVFIKFGTWYSQNAK